MEAPMCESFEDEKTVLDAYADPFFDVEWDCEEQTGGDWYMLALTASLGGKAIHGLNCAPTCETLAKVPYEVANKRTHGLIKIDDSVRAMDGAGDDYDMQQFKHPNFKGVQTTAGTMLAFDQGAWEPSVRTRAREASFLAAGIAAHTSDASMAVAVVSKIVADEVDEEAVHVASIPVSHLKREVVAVNKGSHRLFSRGNFQKSVVWEDQNLNQDSLPPQAAMDWARVTTIARYIAEANARYDGKFKEIAKVRGIPFQIIKGSWAYVAPGDFIPDAGAFADVPDYDARRLRVPSLRDVYSGHQMDVLAAANHALSRSAYDTSPLSTEALLRMVSAVRERTSKKKKVVSRGTEELAEITAHRFDAQGAADAVVRSTTAFTEYAAAASRMLHGNKPAMKLAKVLVSDLREGVFNHQKAHELAPHLFGQGVWSDALTEMASKLLSVEVARTRLARLKRSWTKSSLMLDVPIAFHGNMLRKLEEATGTVAKVAIIKPAPKVNTLAVGLNDRALTGVLMVHAASSFARQHLGTSKELWASRYESWSEAYAANPAEYAYEKSVMYGTAASAFRDLTVDTILMVESRFVDGSAPKKSYIFRAAKAYSRKRRLSPPKNFDRTFTSALDIARKLDDQYDAEIRFEDVEEFCFHRMSEFATDLLGKEIPEVPEDPDDLEEYQEEEYDAGEAEGDYDEMDDLLFGDYEEESLESKVFRTYDSMEIADVFARANGYLDFQDAFAVLGEKARNDPETEYTMKGMAEASAIQKTLEGDAIIA